LAPAGHLAGASVLEEPTPMPPGQPPFAPLPASNSPDFVISSVIGRGDIPALCARARAALEAIDVDSLVCDVGAIVEPDAVTIDAIARLQLTARRLGRRIQLRDASGRLLELLAFVGLSEVLPLGAPSGIESRGQAEEREQARGVEKERDPADPPA
jgi:hypothetical protein